MVLRFTEEGGFNTEEGLFREASGVSSNASFVSKDGIFFFWASGVLMIGIFLGSEELIWFSTSSELYALSEPFANHPGSPFVKSFLHSVLGIAITLLRTEDGDLMLEQRLFSRLHNRT